MPIGFQKRRAPEGRADLPSGSQRRRFRAAQTFDNGPADAVFGEEDDDESDPEEAVSIPDEPG